MEINNIQQLQSQIEEHMNNISSKKDSEVSIFEKENIENLFGKDESLQNILDYNEAKELEELLQKYEEDNNNADKQDISKKIVDFLLGLFD